MDKSCFAACFSTFLYASLLGSIWLVVVTVIKFYDVKVVTKLEGVIMKNILLVASEFMIQSSQINRHKSRLPVMTVNDIRLKINNRQNRQTFIKTGGLADVVGALPKMFPKEEYDVRVVIPNYTCIPWEYREKFQYVHHFKITDFGQIHIL